MDTLLEEEVEDVGEYELEAAPEVPSPVRRKTALAARDEEEEGESMGLRVLMIATTAVLVLGIPVALSVSAGTASDLAKKVAGLFPGVEF